MALRFSQIRTIQPVQLTNILEDPSRKVRLIDCRSFLEFNDNHIIGAVNICCSKLIKRRLQQDKISLKDLLLHCRIEIDETSDVIVYDQRSVCVEDITPDSFLYVLLKKLLVVFGKVCILTGGFVEFQVLYPELCENMMWKYPGLTALSQPCLPTTSTGPTRILPFLYLGSEEDANNKELLQSHNITYELNVSNKCPKPDFIPEGHFMRIPVNDSHNEKLVSYFAQTFQFVEKVRKSNECALVHCLAGISRSPTVAIAYIMRHMTMSCEDAYRYVKSKRATISPNFNFLGQLLEYEQQLISEKILENKDPSHPCPVSTSQPHSSELFLGPQTLCSPQSSTTTFSQKSIGKRVNLSLRISPYSGSSALGSPKDASPTTAMARLQFDKPLGKENRTATSTCGFSPCMPMGLNLGGLGVSIQRPTRLVKEQNVTSIQEEEVGHWGSMTKSVTRQSVSISFSKGFKSRKSSVEQSSSTSTDQSQSTEFRQESEMSNLGENSGSSGNAKKFRVHKFTIEADTEKPCDKEVDTTDAGRSSDSVNASRDTISDEIVPPAGVMCSPSSCKRDYLRSDSVSTSGIGSEISDHDLLASGSWDPAESVSGQDDGVFSDSYSLYSKSPKSSRQLQLWSSDSGHWSSADDGAFSSCSSSTIEVPAVSTATEAKSPEKRKCSEYLFPMQGIPLTSFEKRRSFAGPASTDWLPGNTSRPKRWSLAEDTSDPASTNGPGRWEDLETETNSKSGECSKDAECEDKTRTSSSSSSSHLNFGHHWFNLLSGRELKCCERGQGGGDGLYRVQSCPGICGHPDWLQSHNQVPESPPEPISDSALLKMRTCRNRNKHLGASDQPGRKNRFSCGSIDYDELWSKLRKIHDSKNNDSHSSSSTLASSSYSIVVQ